MRTLFLDIASHHGLLARVTRRGVIAHRPIDHRIGDHELAPLIEEVLKEAGDTPVATHLACVVGPGGFTSLRVGVSCINALSWALKIPVAGIHLSDLYAIRAVSGERLAMSSPKLPFEGLPRHRGLGIEMSPSGPNGKAQDFVWLHSAKRTELFIRGFGDFAKEWPDATHIGLDDLLSKLQSPKTYNLKPKTYTGELLPEHRTAIEGAGFAQLSLRPVLDVLPPFLSSLTYANQMLKPWYGRGW